MSLNQAMLSGTALAQWQQTRPSPNPWTVDCPSRELIALVGSKWVMLILPLLAEGPQRNGELMKRIGGVSQKMLTQTLRDLERHGLVARRDYNKVPPKVDYLLTPLGASLCQTLVVLDQWVIDNFYAMWEARSKASDDAAAS